MRNFFGWQGVSDAVVSDALTHSSLPTETKDHFPRQAKHLCLAFWTTDMVSLRLQDQLKAAGEILGMTAFRALPAGGSSLLSLADTLHSTFQSFDTPADYVVAIRHPAAGVAYQLANASF